MSTLAELAGFVLISVAAWLITPIAGLAVAGACLLLIGYALDDEAVLGSFRKLRARLRRTKNV